MLSAKPWPVSVTLYVEQWGRLLDFAEEIRKFMKDHDAELKRKEQ